MLVLSLTQNITWCAGKQHLGYTKSDYIYQQLGAAESAKYFASKGRCL